MRHTRTIFVYISIYIHCIQCFRSWGESNGIKQREQANQAATQDAWAVARQTVPLWPAEVALALLQSWQAQKLQFLPESAVLMSQHHLQWLWPMPNCKATAQPRTAGWSSAVVFTTFRATSTAEGTLSILGAARMAQHPLLGSTLGRIYRWCWVWAQRWLANTVALLLGLALAGKILFHWLKLDGTTRQRIAGHAFMELCMNCISICRITTQADMLKP